MNFSFIIHTNFNYKFYFFKMLVESKVISLRGFN